jgi:hypothetical protein
MNESFLKQFLRPKIDNAVGDRLKSLLRQNPPWYARPWSKDVTISDLIPWRCDNEWNTRFDVLNIPSLVFPEDSPKDKTLLVIFDADGMEIKRIENTLEPFRVKNIIFDEILDDHRGYGTFACFHHAPTIDPNMLNGSFFIDRQYVGFKRYGEPLWSFAHGNVTALTHRPGARKFGCLTTRPKDGAVYRPQIHFNDCDKFELVYVNSTLRKVDISVKFLNEDRKDILSLQEKISPAGIKVFEYNNKGRKCVSIEHKGSIELWRPIVFKYYSTHFDVLHS